MPNRSIHLIPETTIAAAQTFTGDAKTVQPGTRSVALHTLFAYGSGGTTCKVYLQTSVDGATWVDIACHAYATTAAEKVSANKADIARAVATPTDGSLADNTLLDGFIGEKLRVKVVVAGTYAGASSIAAHVVIH